MTSICNCKFLGELHRTSYINCLETDIYPGKNPRFPNGSVRVLES